MASKLYFECHLEMDQIKDEKLENLVKDTSEMTKFKIRSDYL